MTTNKNISNISIGIILFPNLTQLDFTGPYEVFSKLPNTQVYLLSETLDPIRSERGLTFLPDTTFAKAPDFDVLVVPGGPGVNLKLEDSQFLHFVRTREKKPVM